jgi:hypothetical protein
MRTVLNPATGELITVLARLEEHTDIPDYPTVAGTYSLEYTQASDSFAWTSGGGSDGNGILDAGNDAGAIAVSSLSLAASLNIGSNALVIDGANGRVGVGIAAPTSDLHVHFTDSLFGVRGFNISNPSQLIFGANHDGKIGIGAQPNAAASGGAWINMETMGDPTVGINFVFKAANTLTKEMFKLSSDPTTGDASFTFINITDSRNNGNKNKLGLGINLTQGGGTGIMKAIQIANGISLMRDVETGIGDAYHIGPNNSNNTWKIVISGNDLVFQRREGGSYVTKSTISA